MDVAAAIGQATARLKASGIDGARHEAELLLSLVLGVDWAALLRQPVRELSPAARARFDELVARRQARWPLAYLIGEREFFSLPMRVTPQVLIPRPETEVLVEAALAHLVACPGAALLAADVGTGSGCIAAALLAHEQRLRVIALERSPGAARIARANLEACIPEARRHAVVVMDCVEAVAAGASFDLIASNPPYVLPCERPSLAPELAFEPEEALFAPAVDPLRFYRRLAAAAASHLKPGGLLAVEVHAALADQVARLIGTTSELTQVTLRPDLAGLPRVVLAKKREN